MLYLVLYFQCESLNYLLPVLIDVKICTGHSPMDLHGGIQVHPS